MPCDGRPARKDVRGAAATFEAHFRWDVRCQKPDRRTCVAAHRSFRRLDLDFDVVYGPSAGKLFSARFSLRHRSQETHAARTRMLQTRGWCSRLIAKPQCTFRRIRNACGGFPASPHHSGREDIVLLSSPPKVAVERQQRPLVRGFEARRRF